MVRQSLGVNQTYNEKERKTEKKIQMSYTQISAETILIHCASMFVSSLILSESFFWIKAEKQRGDDESDGEAENKQEKNDLSNTDFVTIKCLERYFPLPLLSPYDVK